MIKCYIIVVCEAGRVFLSIDGQIKILDVCGPINQLDEVNITGVSLRCEIYCDCIGW